MEEVLVYKIVSKELLELEIPTVDGWKLWQI
jgi:hypothetical protein